MKHQKKTKSRKAQIEIMGIALVVVLITIGIVFVAKYSATPPKHTQEEFQRRELPKTIITSLVETASTCKDEKMGDVIQDCGFARMLNCPGDPCTYLNENFKIILDTMLGKFNYEYQIRLLREGSGQALAGAASDNFNVRCDTFETSVQPMIQGLSLELTVCY